MKSFWPVTASQGLWILLENSLIYIHTGATAYQTTNTTLAKHRMSQENFGFYCSGRIIRLSLWPLFSVCKAILLQPEAVLDNIVLKLQDTHIHKPHTPSCSFAFGQVGACVPLWTTVSHSLCLVNKHSSTPPYAVSPSLPSSLPPENSPVWLSAVSGHNNAHAFLKDFPYASLIWVQTRLIQSSGNYHAVDLHITQTAGETGGTVRELSKFTLL